MEFTLMVEHIDTKAAHYESPHISSKFMRKPTGEEIKNQANMGMRVPYLLLLIWFNLL